jgi:phosphoribosylglycinamide formyltransferase-1
MIKKRLAVLLSNKGTGSNLAAIIKAVEDGKIKNAKVVVVVSNKADAYGLVRAEEKNIPTELLDLKDYFKEGKTRAEYDEDLGKLLKEKYNVDLVVLAGWMLILSDNFIKYFPNKTINLHPALLPDYGERYVILSNGQKIPAIRGERTDDAVAVAIKNKYSYSGSTVHFITNKVDEGPVIIRSEVKIRKNDTVESLYARMKEEEYIILPKAINLYCQDRIKIKKGKVVIV